MPIRFPQHGCWRLVFAALLTAGCAQTESKRSTIATTNPPQQPPSQVAAQVELPQAPPNEQTGAVSHISFSESPDIKPTAVQLVSGEEPAGEVLTAPPGERETYPIDLASALMLAGGDNLQIAFARAQWREAAARSDAAAVAWLPSLRAGMNYNKHEGALQDVEGRNIQVSRGAFYAGGGASAVGAASPAVPGVFARFHLADAIFEPEAARRFASSQRHMITATQNDILLQVANAYLELLRASQDKAIAIDVAADAQRLAELTGDYARTGEGLMADSERASVELSFRRNEVVRSEEAVMVASARLAELLRLDPATLLEPVEPVVTPVTLVPAEREVRDLVAEGLSLRPELSANRALVGQAVERLKREQYAPLVPSVLLGMSYGAFGAGEGSFIGGTDDRMDFDAVAYWEVRNFGAGEREARNVARSQIQQARAREMAMLDQVAREVAQEHARVVSRRRQIEIAREGTATAASAYRRNLDRIQNAQGLPIEVLQSIQALAQARREYLRTVVEYNTSQFALYHALGWPAQLPEGLSPPSTLK